MTRRYHLLLPVLCASSLAVGACVTPIDEPVAGSEVTDTKTLAAGEDGRLYDSDCVQSAQDAESCVSLDNPDDCETLLIETYDDGSRCQLCSSSNGDLLSERCALESSALCTEETRPDGSRCVACSDDSGLVHYTDCQSAGALTAMRCQDLYDRDGTPCVACFDATGEMVSRDCFAENGSCVEYVAQDGSVCRQCEGVDGSSSATCVPPAQLAQCDVTTDANGVECVTCYAEDGLVAHHRCQDVAPPEDPGRCEESVTAYGEHCRRCYTDDGDVIFEACSAPPPRACNLQFNDDGTTCEVCTSAQGELIAIQCTEPPCRTDTCDAPPTCQIYEQASGAICEVCAVLDDAGNPTLAERCFEQPADPVFCEVLYLDDGTTCEVCKNSLGEVHRACTHPDDAWTPQPSPDISCVHRLSEQNGVLIECETCFDELGHIVHESCPQERTCFLDTFVREDQYVTCEVCWSTDGTERRSCDVVPCAEAPHLCGSNAHCWLEHSDDQSQMCELCVVDDRLLRRCAGHEGPCDPWYQDCFAQMRCEPYLDEQNDRLVSCERCVTATGESSTTCHGVAPCPSTDPECARATAADCWDEWLMDAVGRPIACTFCDRGDAGLFWLCRPEGPACPTGDPSCGMEVCHETIPDPDNPNLLCVVCERDNVVVAENCWEVLPPECERDPTLCNIPTEEECREWIDVDEQGREILCVKCLRLDGSTSEHCKPLEDPCLDPQNPGCVPPPPECFEYEETVVLDNSNDVLSLWCTECPYPDGYFKECISPAGRCDPIYGSSECPPPECRELPPQTTTDTVCWRCDFADGSYHEDCHVPPPPPCDPDLDPSCVVSECTETKRVDAFGNDLVCVHCTHPDGLVTEDCWPVEPLCDGLDCPPPGEECIDSVAVTDDGQELSCVHCFGPQGELLYTDCVPIAPPPCDPDLNADCALPGECWEEWTPHDDGTGTVCKVCMLETGIEQRDCWHEGLPPPPDDRVVVFTDPVQCEGNPWNGIIEDDGTDFVGDFEELVAWLGSLGVEIFAIENVPLFDDVVVCMSCDCGRGDRYYVETNHDGAAVLDRYGFLRR